MTIYQDLLHTPAGLASLAIILFMIGMGAFIYGFVRKQMARDKEKASGSSR